MFRPIFMANPIKLMQNTPAEAGYSMPAEWAKHEATWLGWPHNPTDWPDKLDTIRWIYTEIVRHISPGERVRILVQGKQEEKLARAYLKLETRRLQPPERSIHPTPNQSRLDEGQWAHLCCQIRQTRSRTSHNCDCSFSFQCLGQVQRLAT
jgi:hypothetical protein